MTTRLLYLTIVILLFAQCKIKSPAPEPITQNIRLLDSTAAAQVISEDKIEGFFDKIRKLDMEIQMKQQLPDNRAEQIETYKDFLRKDVADFSKEETEFVKTAMEKAKVLCDKISPDIFPKGVKLLKTKAEHYGTSVYYTREDAIVIPYNVLGGNEDSFLETMLHEIFHVYSRLNPDKRAALYQLIGFEKIKPLKLPEKLDRQVLLNPDGIDIRYAITLKDDAGSTKAIPLIYSKKAAQNPDTPDFFSYLEFALFEIKKTEKSWSVLVGKEEKSSLRETLQADFHRQIGPNTDYIIHPDEILADNFMILAMSKSDATGLSDLKPTGQELLREIEAVLK